MENLTNDTPPEKGVWTPLVRYVFHPRSGVSALFFCLCKTPRQSRPRSSFGGVQKFSGERFRETFSSPHTFCTPPISRPNCSWEIRDPHVGISLTAALGCPGQTNSPSFSQNSPSLPQNSVRLSEFPSPKQYSRNSIPPVPFKNYQYQY